MWRGLRTPSPANNLKIALRGLKSWGTIIWQGGMLLPLGFLCQNICPPLLFSSSINSPNKAPGSSIQGGCGGGGLDTPIKGQPPPPNKTPSNNSPPPQEFWVPWNFTQKPQKCLPPDTLSSRLYDLLSPRTQYPAENFEILFVGKNQPLSTAGYKNCAIFEKRGILRTFWKEPLKRWWMEDPPSESF